MFFLLYFLCLSRFFFQASASRPLSFLFCAFHFTWAQSPTRNSDGVTAPPIGFLRRFSFSLFPLFSVSWRSVRNSYGCSFSWMHLPVCPAYILRNDKGTPYVAPFRRIDTPDFLCFPFWWKKRKINTTKVATKLARTTVSLSVGSRNVSFSISNKNKSYKPHRVHHYICGVSHWISNWHVFNIEQLRYGLSLLMIWR